MRAMLLGECMESWELEGELGSGGGGGEDRVLQLTVG